MNILALEASANNVTLALQVGDERFEKEIPTLSKSSAWIIPATLELMQSKGLQLRDLNCIAYGQGPGAFTGLRTVCSVVQGFSLGLDHKVNIFGVNTLMQLAQSYFNQIQENPLSDAQESSADEAKVLCILDARMDEWYIAGYQKNKKGWTNTLAPQLCKPSELELLKAWDLRHLCVASNVDQGLIKDSLAGASHSLEAHIMHAEPRASLCIDIVLNSPEQLPLGSDQTQELALPLYVRERVALTTIERELLKTYSDAHEQ
jgi:tRNA threonylcarbamoyladenosine biosynthesis protein TsaB